MRWIWSALWFPTLALAALAAALMGCAGSDETVPSTHDAKLDAGLVLPPALDAGSTVVHDAQGPIEAAVDAAVVLKVDAGTGGGSCALGAAGSFATDQSLDLFGNVIYFAKGQTLPKGRYRVSYQGGCMKYNFLFGWAVNAFTSELDGWWLVGATSSERISVLPGKSDSYPSFDGCVMANQQLVAKEFDFAGGKLGIWLNDFPYQDNVAGEAGQNPKWKLELLESVCPPEIVLE